MLRGERGEWIALALVGMLAAAAVWLSSPGSFVPDIKPEVYLAPWRSAVDYLAAWREGPFLGSASFDVGLAPVALLVAGLDALGAEPAVAVRLLRLALLVVGALGARAFVRSVSNDRLTRAGRVVAAVAYVANPYVVVAGSTLAILLPWALLPWFALAVLAALRHQSAWRYPVMAGLAFAAMTGINAGVVPLMQLLLVPALIFATRTEQVPWQHIISSLARTAVVVAALSAYWLVPALDAMSTGAVVLAHSESPEAIAAPSSAAEVLRGLGLWPMYGGDGGDPWQPGFSGYIGTPLLVLLTGLLPALVLAALAVVRRRTAVVVLLLVVPAAVIMVGQHPPDHPSPLGRTLGWLFEHVPAVAAFRTTNKAGSVLVLGAALALAGAAAYVVRGTPARWRIVAGIGVFGLVTAAAVHPALAGRLFTVEYDVPDYWRAAATDLDAADDDSRVWFLPGQSQADYVWTEPIPDDLDKALLDRPSVIRYTQPTASAPAANLLLAADTMLQERTAPPEALRVYARYLGVGQLLVRRDQHWQPWHGASPAEVDAQVRGSDGVRPGATYGEPGANTDSLSPLQVFDVVRGGSLVSIAPIADEVLIAGDGFAVTPAAQVGLLDGFVPFRYLADLDTPALVAALDRGARLVMTDSNRRVDWQQNRLTAAHGPLLAADESPSTSFALGGTDDQTVLVVEGAKATARPGGSGTLPWAAPELVLDGDPETAWQFGDSGRGLGARLDIELAELRAVHEIGVRIARLGPREIAWVRIMAGERSRLVEVGSDGVAVADFGGVVTDRLAVAVVDDRGDGDNMLGVSEVTVEGVGAHRVARLPLTLTNLAEGLDDQGRTALAATPLDVLLSRQIGMQGATPDEERTLDRDLVLPDDRDFVLEGHGKLEGSGGGHALDALLGGDPQIVASASSTAFDLLTVRGSQAVDGDGATAWLPGAPVIGSSLQLTGPGQALDEIVVAQRQTVDGSHISEMEVTVDGVSLGRYPLSAGETTIPLGVPEAGQLTLTITALSNPAAEELVGISELEAGAWSLELDPLQEAVGRCVPIGTVDGAPLEAAVAEPIGDDGTFTLANCGADPLHVDAGERRLRSNGPWLLDRLYLLDPEPAPGARLDSLPEIRLREWSPRLRTVAVGGVNGPFLLVLNEAAGKDWTASIDGVEVGPATQVNGYASAWPLDLEDDAVVELRYEPQGRADAALAASLLALAGCLVVLVRGRKPGLYVSAADPAGVTAAAQRERGSVRQRVRWSVLLGAGAWFGGGPWLLGVAATALAVDVLIPMGRRTLVLAGAALVAAAPVAYLLANRGKLVTVTPDLVTGAPLAHLLALSGLLLVVMAHLPHRAARTVTSTGTSGRP
ncbi:MAG TPA: alpha-(1-_3)-arabinofuranosyltransferase family protein [Jiangellaceae bacterium]|nr:alpha-(1->3)-arabinofuranosyltransferase family protein [Jiangellaceae bacterium]